MRGPAIASSSGRRSIMVVSRIWLTTVGVTAPPPPTAPPSTPLRRPTRTGDSHCMPLSLGVDAAAITTPVPGAMRARPNSPLALVAQATALPERSTTMILPAPGLSGRARTAGVRLATGIRPPARSIPASSPTCAAETSCWPGSALVRSGRCQRSRSQCATSEACASRLARSPAERLRHCDAVSAMIWPIITPLATGGGGA
jgi:hypothetical protein